MLCFLAQVIWSDQKFFAEIFLYAVDIYYIISCILQVSSKQAWLCELSQSTFYWYCFFCCSAWRGRYLIYPCPIKQISLGTGKTKPQTIKNLSTNGLAQHGPAGAVCTQLARRHQKVSAEQLEKSNSTSTHSQSHTGKATKWGEIQILNEHSKLVPTFI